MLKTITKTAWTFKNPAFPGEAKMCLSCMHFRAPPAALKQKNDHNSRNVQPIKVCLRGLFKFMKTPSFRLSFQNTVRFKIVRSFFIFSIFLFLFQRHMHSIFVWNMIHIYTPDFYNDTCIYIFLWIMFELIG